jgi:MSHA biogenesis protein MshP
MKTAHRRIGGFTLMSTLFLLVVVSALAGYLVNISTAQHLGSALTVNTVRARHAALSGIDWLSYRVSYVSNTCPPLPTAMTIEGFVVQVTACRMTDVSEGGDSYRLFDVTVNASRGAFGDADYVNLAVRATLGG